MKRLIAMLLATAMLGAPADLLGKTTGGTEEKTVKKTEMTFIDSKALDEGIEKLLKEQRVDSSLVSVALEFTATGETYYYNADQWMYTASLCKLPVAMTYAHMLKTGELKPSTKSGGDEYVLKKILIESNYPNYANVASKIYGSVESIAQRTQDVAYSKFDTDLLPNYFYNSQKYSARFYLGIIRELYDNSEEYPDVIEYMKQASPDKYFRETLGEKYEIAQKYGSANKVVHAAGIIYTDCPVLLVITTNNQSDASGNKIIGKVSEYLANQAADWSDAYLKANSLIRECNSDK